MFNLTFVELNDWRIKNYIQILTPFCSCLLAKLPDIYITLASQQVLIWFSLFLTEIEWEAIKEGRFWWLHWYLLHMLENHILSKSLDKYWNLMLLVADDGRLKVEMERKKVLDLSESRREKMGKDWSWREDERWRRDRN